MKVAEPHVEELTDVPSEKLHDLEQSFLADGAAKVDIKVQPDGLFTIRAFFVPDAWHGSLKAKR